jgi:hypothetical protein
VVSAAVTGERGNQPRYQPSRGHLYQAARPDAPPALTQETTMNPIIHHDLMQARVADLHRQARRDAQARAASQARHARTPQPTHRVPGLTALMARRVRTVLGGTA